MSIRHLVRATVLAAATVATVLATTGCAPMTPSQQEAAELRAYCGTRPERDPDRCFVFIGAPGG